jgi:hypothetical protein
MPGPVPASSPAPTLRGNAASLSIVIEWENARLAEAERSLRMLGELARQLDDLARTSSRAVDILLLFNLAVMAEAAIEALIDHVRPRADWPAMIRLLPSGERGYYEQKNFGVQHTAGDIVLFVDSDVVPEPGWLERLLTSFDPEVGVVCGSTYVECGSFYERAVALFWLFPLRLSGEGLEEASSFYANNVAFRRTVIGENPFPISTPSAASAVPSPSAYAAKGSGSCAMPGPGCPTGRRTACATSSTGQWPRATTRRCATGCGVASS